MVASRKQRNPLGWILRGGAAFGVLSEDASFYAVADYRLHHGGLPLGWEQDHLCGRWEFVGLMDPPSTAGRHVPAAAIHPRQRMAATHISARLIDPICAPQLMSVKEALARPFGGSWLP